MNINHSIFKAYDIRGIYPTDLNEELAEAIGKAYAKLLRTETDKEELTVVLGMDMRLSSPELKAAVIKGLTEAGLNVVDVGLVSTPTFYFSVGYYGYDGGLQVSASHNPKEYNGFKMVREKGIPISGDSGIMQMRDWIANDELEVFDKKGNVTQKEGALADLIKDQTQGVDLNAIKPFKIVADAANSMGALYLKALFDVLPAELIQVNFTLDGSFPSHEADPLKEENLELLKEKVAEHQADFGIATDGDGDRLFIVMENGETLPPEILRGILAQIVLERYPGAPIGYDVRPGKITEDMIVAAGGKPFMTRVGHSLIKEQMLKENSPFSGESSAHFFYKFPYGSFEAPVKMMVDFMTWLTQQNKPLSEAIKPYQQYYHSGEINSEVEDKEEVMKKLAEIYSEGEINWLDGVTVEYPDYWFNVRPSNTEPKLRLNLEARSPDIMAKKRDEVLGIIRGES